MSWRNFRIGRYDYHVVPINDLRDHETVRDCWCRPRETDPGIIVHNSMDRREEYEDDRVLNGPVRKAS